MTVPVADAASVGVVGRVTRPVRACNYRHVTPLGVPNFGEPRVSFRSGAVETRNLD